MSKASKALSFINAAKKNHKKRSISEQGRTIFQQEFDTQEYRIVLGGNDVTPIPLDPNIFQPYKGEYEIPAESDTSLSLEMKFTSPSAALFKNPLHTQNIEGPSQYRHSIFIKSDNELEDFMGVTECDVSDRTPITPDLGSDASEDSLTRGKQELDRSKIPQHISLILSETDTFFILDLPSSTALTDSEEGLAVEEDNKHYEFLTEGKGRNRRVFEAEAQTTKILLKTRSTQADRQTYEDGSTFASNWETYDILHPPQASNIQIVASDMLTAEEGDEDDDIDDPEHKLDDIGDQKKTVATNEEKQFSKLVRTRHFKNALCVIERLLANNCYNYQQKRFRGLADPDEHREGIEYKYRLNLLWTFRNDKTQGRCVTALHWNKVDQDIVAVAYGKFYFMDVTTGMVMLWNIKNPNQPEREYHFEDPVTSVCFSTLTPHLLAIGFYYGSVIVIDVSKRELDIVAKCDRTNSPSFEAVWDVLWDIDEENAKKEHILACFEDGRVCKFIVSKGSLLKCLQIMRVARAEGKLKGMSMMRICDTSSISISRYAAALFITKHPKEKSMYYVGTNEGVIHSCSMNYLNQHLDLFRAHNGPVYNMRFSPFCNRLFVTCGDDWYVRMWVDGISVPIAEMTKNMDTVQGVDWSPSHSTILVVIRGREINVWDIQRKIYSPQSVTISPTNSRNTIVKFTDNGRCLVVGDIDGNVHVFSLEDMPFYPFFQDDLLIQALRRALVAEPDLSEKLKKFGKLSYSKKSSRQAQS